MKALKIAVLRDPVEEGWPSMDLVGEMLVDELRRTEGVKVRELEVGIPRALRRVPGLPSRGAFNADRLLTRFGLYPAIAARARRSASVFHVVDHSYAQLTYALPRERTGVYCHDLDTFRCVLAPADEPRRAWFRAMASVVLRGMQRAALVFHSTRVVGDDIRRRGLVDERRLVHAPYGVSAEFSLAGGDVEAAARVLAPLSGRPFILHVGSALQRKRLDILLETFARLRSKRPDLRLVQQGAAFTPDLRALAARLGITDAILQPPKLPRPTLVGLYRKAQLVLVPSDAEGFGLPVLEALATGAPVLASDIPVLREVGGEAAVYAPVGNLEAWTARAAALLDGDATPSVEARLSQARRFTWGAHARTILEAYRALE